MTRKRNKKRASATAAAEAPNTLVITSYFLYFSDCALISSISEK